MAPAASLAVLEASGAVGRSLVPLVARSDRSRAAARQFCTAVRPGLVSPSAGELMTMACLPLSRRRRL